MSELMKLEELLLKGRMSRRDKTVLWGTRVLLLLYSNSWTLFIERSTVVKLREFFENPFYLLETFY